MQTSRLGDGRAHLTDAGAGLGPCALRRQAHDRSRLQARQVKCSARHAARDAAAPASALNPGALSDRFGDSLRGTRDSSDGARTPHRTDSPNPKSAGRPARPAWSSRRSSSYSPVAAPPAPSALSAAPTTTRETPWRRAPFATAVTGWATAALSADRPPPSCPPFAPRSYWPRSAASAAQRLVPETPLSTARPRFRRVLRPSAAHRPPLHSAGGGRRAAGAFGAGRAPPRPLVLGAPPPLLTGVLRRHPLHLRGHRVLWQHRDGGLALRRQLGGRQHQPDLKDRAVRASACPPPPPPPPSPRPQRLRRPLGPSSPQELAQQGSHGHGADGAGASAAADPPVRPAPLPPGRL